MTKWKMACVHVTLKTALRCGDRPLGMVARCLPFVPGHIPLMAMVPPLVRKLCMPDTYDSYRNVQKFAEAHIRFTPFFISTGDERKYLIPESHSQTTTEVEFNYLASHNSVAIDYETRGARDGYLFEIESIQPVSRQKTPTCLIGWVFWKPVNSNQPGISVSEAGTINDQFAISELVALSQWGGERNKGYGCLKDVSARNTENAFGADVDLDGTLPVLTWPADSPAPVYLQYDKEKHINNQVSGVLKPLVGRVFDKDKGAGQASATYGGGILWDVGWRAEKPLDLRLETHSATAI